MRLHPRLESLYDFLYSYQCLELSDDWYDTDSWTQMAAERYPYQFHLYDAADEYEND